MRLEFFIIGVCLLVGCNADPRCRRETALLRAEILDLEDQYYLLKSRHESLLAELDGQGVNVHDPVIMDGGVMIEGDIYSDNFIEEPYQQFQHPHVPGETIGNGIDSPEFNLDPDIDGRSLEIILPANDPDPTDGSHLPLDGPTYGSVAPEQSLRSSISQVDSIAINRMLTRGQDVDGIEGDEGISLLIQPTSATGEIVLESGDLTVSLIDPQASGESQRVGLWKFVAEEAALFYYESAAASGIMLRLPWDQSIPEHSELIVFVRFVTADGRSLETSRRVAILPPGPDYSAQHPLISQWTMGTDVTREPTKPPPLSSSPAPNGTSRLEAPTWRPVR